MRTGPERQRGVAPEATVRGTPGRWWLAAALTALLGASGCTAGLQQTLLSPKVDGKYSFSGVDLVAQSPPSWSGQPYTLPIKLDPRGGQVGPLSSVTQLPLGLDLPFLRLVIAPGLNAPAEMEVFQFDALYKHQLQLSGSDRLKALIGVSYHSLAARVVADYQLAISSPVQIGDAWLQNGDAVRYESSESRQGWFGTVGAEYELADWAHLVAQISARFSQSGSRQEDLTITARNGGVDSQGRTVSEDFHVLTDNRFVVQAKQRGVVSADFDLPNIAATVGITFTWPSWKQLKSRSLFTPPPPPRYAPPAAGPAPAYGPHPTPYAPPAGGRAPRAPLTSL